MGGEAMMQPQMGGEMIRWMLYKILQMLIENAKKHKD
jgi:hypothetical protein